MKSHPSKSVPFAIAVALAFAVAPVQAAPPVGQQGGSGGSHAPSGGGAGGGHPGSGGGGSHPSFGGGHVGGGGGTRVVVHNGGAGSQSGHPFAHGGSPIQGGGYVSTGSTVYGYAGDSSSFGGDSNGSPSPYVETDTSTSGDASVVYLYPGRPSPVATMATSVQVALANSGYYHGAIDGIIGPTSMMAISAYQRRHGLPVTGLVDAFLYRSLGIY